MYKPQLQEDILDLFLYVNAELIDIWHSWTSLQHGTQATLEAIRIRIWKCVVP